MSEQFSPPRISSATSEMREWKYGFKWQEQKLSMIKIFKVFISDHLKIAFLLIIFGNRNR